jgi:hypothetical protein
VSRFKSWFPCHFIEGVLLKEREAYNAYMRSYMLKRYHEKRNEIIKLLGAKCVKCASTENLELDHIDAKTRLFDYAKRLHTASQPELKIELSKAQLLCRVCHSIKSIYEAGNKPVEHGTVTMYVNYKCRCSPCKLARSVYNKSYKKLKRDRGAIGSAEDF